VSSLKDEKLTEKQTYMKTETRKVANSILEFFEYFCQRSSKSILIIPSRTASKLLRFLRHSV